MTEQYLFEWTAKEEKLLGAFENFHRSNPKVWQLFKRFAFHVIERGHQNYSSDAICHRIRWHTSVETKCEDGFKICNNHTAYYARLFHLAFPQHGEFFRLRATRETEHYINERLAKLL